MSFFLYDILLELAKENVDFVICGGLALVLQGGERTTYDVDINISVEKSNLERAIEIFKREGYAPRIPEPIESLLDEKKRQSWVKEKDAIVYTVVSKTGQVQVDIFLTYPIEYNALKKNADLFEIDGYSVPVSSKKDLIKAKEAITPLREKDRFDIRILEELINNERTDKE